VTTVRVGQHPGYDRFVIEFGGGVPAYTVTPQQSATFTRSPKGDQVTIEGTAGVVIVVHAVNNWTSYSGPIAFHPRYPYLRQALQVENFGGY
jgi:formylmethanofuran dehydrogenase subunit D